MKRGLQQARRWKHIHAVSLLLANFAALALVVQGCQERNHLTQDAGQMRAAYVQKEKKKVRPHVPFTAACEWQRWEAACRQLCPRQVAAQIFEGCASAVKLNSQPLQLWHLCTLWLHQHAVPASTARPSSPKLLTVPHVAGAVKLL